MSFDRSAGQSRSAERRREALREIREELERLRRAEAKVGEGLGSMRAARHRVEELVRGLMVEEDAVRKIIREEMAAGVAVRPWEVGARAAAAESVSRAEVEPGAVRMEPGAPPAEAAEAAAGVRGGATPGVRGGGAAVPWAPERAGDPRERPPSPATITVARTPRLQERRAWLVGVATVSALVIGGIAWLAVQAFKSSQPTPTLTIGDSTPPVVASAPAEPAPEDTSKTETERFFIRLPDDATQRAAVYDSLWQARSPLFASLVGEVESSSSEADVRRAAAAWKTGELSALDQDLLHSALVQLALREEAGATVEVDGQLLRNPCRGDSCTALLDFWRSRGDDVGLPDPPADATRNTRAMRMAESVLVLKVLEERALGSETGE